MLKINHKYECEFKGGKPVLSDPKAFNDACDKMEGKKGYIIITPYRKMKTNDQNKYYRGVVVQILGDYWGSTNQEAHEAISAEHLKYSKHYGMPQLIKSTKLTEWSTVEWEEYMEHLRKWAAQEFGVSIPLPNEVDLTTLPDVYY